MVSLTAIGARIRYARKVNHYTTEELSEVVGISTRFLYDIEKGHKRFSVTILINICNALNVSYDYILTGKNNEYNDQKIIDIINMFDVSQINNVKKVLELVLEISNV